MKDKRDRIIINRDQCMYCSEFAHCQYKQYFGTPADCPKDEREAKKQHAKEPK